MTDVLKILKKTSAILTDGHFVGVSGRHMPVYINKDAFLPHTAEVSKIGKLFADKFKNKKIEIVIGPAVGGVPLSQWTAHHLSKIDHREVLSMFTEKTPNAFSGFPTCKRIHRSLEIRIGYTAKGFSEKNAIFHVGRYADI